MDSKVIQTDMKRSKNIWNDFTVLRSFMELSKSRDRTLTHGVIKRLSIKIKSLWQKK